MNGAKIFILTAALAAGFGASTVASGAMIVATQADRGVRDQTDPVTETSADRYDRSGSTTSHLIVGDQHLPFNVFPAAKNEVQRYIIPFLLTQSDIAEIQNPLSVVSLSLTTGNASGTNPVSGTPGNIDLAILDSMSPNRTSGAVVTSDYYAPATLVADNAFTAADPAPSTERSFDVTSVVRSRVLAGDSILVFRLQADAFDQSDNAADNISFATANAPAGQPTLTVSVVPEPAGACLLGLGGAALFVRRRRHALSPCPRAQ